MASSASTRRPLRRANRIIAVLLGTAVLIVGCSSSQPGTAATVGGQTIPEQSVLDRTSAFLSESGGADPTDVNNSAQVDQINRQQASDLIRHQLVLYAERNQQIPVSQSDINALVAQQGGAATLGKSWSVPSGEVDDLAHDLLVLEKLLGNANGSQFTDVSITIDYLTVNTRDAAVAARSKYLANPAAMAADIAAGGSGQGASGAPYQFSTTPDLATLGLYSAPPGSIVIAPIDAQTFLVARIATRSEKKASLTVGMLSAVQTPSGQLTWPRPFLAPTPGVRE